MQALIAFEPSTGEVIGLFFSTPARESLSPTNSGPAHFEPHVDELALTIGTAPTALGASLTLPTAPSTGRLPAVLFVAGSGPQDRDETIQRAKPFRDLALGLAERGIVALRDRRQLFLHSSDNYFCRVGAGRWSATATTGRSLGMG